MLEFAAALGSISGGSGGGLSSSSSAEATGGDIQMGGITFHSPQAANPEAEQVNYAIIAAALVAVVIVLKKA